MAFESQLLAYVLLALLLALVVSFLMTPVVKTFAYKVGAIDVPKDNRRMHKTPIPRMGGLAIFAGFLISSLIFIPLGKEFRAILLGALILVVLGIIDDVVALKAQVKFLGQIVAALIPVLAGVNIHGFANPFHSGYTSLGVLSVPITVLWIVGITNAVNFIDGLDGLACGVSAIATVTMFIIAVLFGESYVAFTMAALAGACLGFLPYNMNPAKIFMGDTGSMFLGYILAVTSIQGLFKMYAVISFMVPFLILGVPFFDITFAVIRRLAKHQNPMTADRGHIHHRLIDMGLSQKQSVAIVYMLTGVLGLAAVLLANNTGTKAFILFAAVFVVAVLGFAVIFGPHHRPHQNDKKDEEQNHG